MTDEIIAFLKERYEERRRLILDHWDSDGQARVATMWTGTDAGYATVASDHGDDIWVADGREVDTERHVTILWDPAHDLADIESKRKILDIHHRTECAHDHNFSPDGDCGECGDQYPCETVYLLALPYAQHPAFRPQWKVDG